MKTFILTAVIVLSFTLLSAQNMGIKLDAGTLPNTTLDVNGSVSFREGTALNLSNGTNNDVALGNYSFFRITGPTTPFEITGFADGVDGRILVIANNSNQRMTLKNEVTSTATNQILNGGGDIILSGSGTAILMYNGTLQRWLVLINSSNPSEQVILKAADETVSNSTTLQDDNHFTFSMGANNIWLVEGILYVNDESTDGGIKMAFDSGTGTEKMDVINLKGNGISDHSIYLNSSAFYEYGLNANNTNSIHVKGVITGPSSGSSTFKLRWSQKSAKSIGTTVLQNSFLKFTRVN